MAFGIGEMVALGSGIYRLGSRRINWYLVVDDGEITVIDTGAPAHWSQFVAGLETIGRTVADVRAIIVTHGHVDHVGCAERVRRESGAPVYVHEGDAPVVTSRYGLPTHLLARLYRPAVAGLLVEGLWTGLANPSPVETVRTVEDGERLPAPGEPEIISLPGHTPGHVGVWLPERDVLFPGDGLVTLNLLTGRSCPPRPLPAPFTEDLETAYRTLERLADMGEVTMYPGHGEPWCGDIGSVVEELTAAGE